jgi:glycosyltransferase involved in cell wall biosynthesis
LVTEEIKKGTMAVAELKNTSDYILFFGAVDHYKGVDILISAYNRHPESDKHKLVIAGLGNLDKITEPNIIRLNRFIEDAEVRDLFTKAAIVVYPYRSATMSGVLSLAFYFRKKVVMSDVPFFKEYANRDSLFFKAGNVEDLADKLQQALDSGSASTNANLYPEFYSENILEQDYINLYSSPANKQM